MRNVICDVKNKRVHSLLGSWSPVSLLTLISWAEGYGKSYRMSQRELRESGFHMESWTRHGESMPIIVCEVRVSNRFSQNSKKATIARERIHIVVWQKTTDMQSVPSIRSQVRLDHKWKYQLKFGCKICDGSVVNNNDITNVHERPGASNPN